jgi:hypothetical protein
MVAAHHMLHILLLITCAAPRVYQHQHVSQPTTDRVWLPPVSVAAVLLVCSRQFWNCADVKITS